MCPRQVLLRSPFRPSPIRPRRRHPFRPSLPFPPGPPGPALAAGTARVAIPRGGIAAAWGEVAPERSLERPLDDLLRVRVVAELIRNRVDRLLVAVQGGSEEHTSS